LLKFGSAAAVAFSGAAALLLALATLGSRLGWWHYRFGLYWLMPSSGYLAAIAVILSIVTLALGWSQLRLRGRVILSVTLLLARRLPMRRGTITASGRAFHPFTISPQIPTTRHHSMLCCQRELRKTQAAWLGSSSLTTS
jgi:hypothetical protein